MCSRQSYQRIVTHTTSKTQIKRVCSELVEFVEFSSNLNIDFYFRKLQIADDLT